MAKTISGHSTPKSAMPMAIVAIPVAPPLPVTGTSDEFNYYYYNYNRYYCFAIIIHNPVLFYRPNCGEALHVCLWTPLGDGVCPLIQPLPHAWP